jgi:hypothetical protein
VTIKIPENIIINNKSASEDFKFVDFIKQTLIQSQYFTNYTTLLELEKLNNLFVGSPGDEIKIPENLYLIVKDVLVSIRFNRPQEGLTVLSWLKYIIQLS